MSLWVFIYNLQQARSPALDPFLAQGSFSEPARNVTGNSWRSDQWPCLKWETIVLNPGCIQSWVTLLKIFHWSWVIYNLHVFWAVVSALIAENPWRLEECAGSLQWQVIQFGSRICRLSGWRDADRACPAPDDNRAEERSQEAPSMQTMRNEQMRKTRMRRT